MTQVKDLYDGMIDALGVENLSVPTACVKFYKQGDEIPAGVRECEPQGLTLTSCQSTRQAGFGDSVLLTPQSIGCVAAAITFGLVDRNQDQPMGESRVYTDIMKGQAADKEHFQPPTPKDSRVMRLQTIHRPSLCSVLSTSPPSLPIGSIRGAKQSTMR